MKDFSHVELWQHEKSGEVYVVVVDDRDGSIRYGCGPLDMQDKINCLHADAADIYDDPEFDADGLRPWSEQQYRNFRAERAA